MTEKSQYKSLSEWQQEHPAAYSAAFRKGLLEKMCEHFDWNRKKPVGYWTLEKCKEDALKYETKTEWRKNSQGYDSSIKNNWIDECCGHMQSRRDWTLDVCKQDALKYKTKSEWKKSIDKGGYGAALKNGWLDECCGHMERVFKPVGYWTLETCKEDALKYNTRNEWKKSHGYVYQFARENEWLEECCVHMEQFAYPKGYWTLDKCKEDALKYNKKSEWKSSSPGYYATQRNEWIEECCKHMISGYANRKV